MAIDYQIGATAGSMVSTLTLSDEWPTGIYYPWTVEYYSADGHSYADGYPRATWHFGGVTQMGVQVLRILCPGKSADVYIRTRTDDDDLFKTFAAIMHWPGGAHADRIWDGTYIGLTIEFTRLVEEEGS